MRRTALALGIAIGGCHARPATSPQQAAVAADARFGARAAAAERYADLAKHDSRMQILAYREATLALLEANLSRSCQETYCSPQLSAANQARLTEIQAIAAGGRPPVIAPPTAWSIDGDRSCEPWITGLNTQKDAPSGPATKVTFTHCDVKIDGQPWVTATCDVVGSEANDPCPGQKHDNEAHPDQISPRQPRPVFCKLPCHTWTAQVGVTVEGAVVVAGRRLPFHHAWRDVMSAQAFAAPPLPPPAWPTVDQLVTMSLVSGYGPVLPTAAHLIAVLVAADHDQLLLACIDLPPHEYTGQPLDFGLYDTAAARCKTVLH